MSSLTRSECAGLSYQARLHEEKHITIKDIDSGVKKSVVVLTCSNPLKCKRIRMAWLDWF